MRIRQHVNPLKSEFFQIAPEPPPLPPGEVEVELGSAEAHFLMERAVESPERFFVGVEIRRDLVTSSNDECARQKLTNVTNVFANISVDLPRLFPQGRVSRFFLNFPDPWWKSKQHKRRVVSPTLFQELHGFLIPGGEICVQTDIFEIALDALAILEGESERFVNQAGPWSFLKKRPVRSKTRRERQCDTDGVPIWRLGFSRRENS